MGLTYESAESGSFRIRFWNDARSNGPRLRSGGDNPGRQDVERGIDIPIRDQAAVPAAVGLRLARMVPGAAPTFMLDREGPGSGRMFGDGRQGGPSGGSEATVARPSLPRTPSLKRLGPCLRADDPQGARLEVLLVALADDWLSKDLPALWQGGRCRAWPGPAAGGGSDRVSDWVLGTVVQLDRPPQQFPQDLNGSRGPDPHSKSRGSRESPWPVERIPINP